MNSSPSPTPPEAFQKLFTLIDELKIAMLTTVAENDTLRSRPMATLQVDQAENVLWFFTASDSPKSDEIIDTHQVGLSYACPKKQSYVSISGNGSISRDRAKIAELWTPMAKIWFPQGVDDPRLALLRVQMIDAEYWDSPSSKVVQLFGLAKIALGGKQPADLGDNAKVHLG